MIQDPVIILVCPQLGENIGMAARAMWNCGFKHLRLVNPRDGWPNEQALKASAGGTSLIENAQVFKSTEEAIADLEYVYATTARPRFMVKPVMDAYKAAQDFENQRFQKVGILFGAEKSGLSNEDVGRSNAIIEIHLNPEFSSLNLAQAVLIVAYEFYNVTQRQHAKDQNKNRGNLEIASRKDVNDFCHHLEVELEDHGFFYPEHKKNIMVQNLRNIFQRMPLTAQEVRTLRGMIRALTERKRKSS
jgi:tRNA/rRNA methyltransferase